MEFHCEPSVHLAGGEDRAGGNGGRRLSSTPGDATNFRRDLLYDGDDVSPDRISYGGGGGCVGGDPQPAAVARERLRGVSSKGAQHAVVAEDYRPSHYVRSHMTTQVAAQERESFL